MKQNLFVVLPCLALLLPSCPVRAQETAAAGQPAAETGAAPAKAQTAATGEFNAAGAGFTMASRT